MVKKKSASCTKSPLKSKSKVVNWAQCEHCYKWRRISKTDNIDSYKKKFTCKQMTSYTCDTPEESWRRQYKTLKIEC